MADLARRAAGAGAVQPPSLLQMSELPCQELPGPPPPYVHLNHISLPPLGSLTS